MELRRAEVSDLTVKGEAPDLKVWGFFIYTGLAGMVISSMAVNIIRMIDVFSQWAYPVTLLFYVVSGEG